MSAKGVAQLLEAFCGTAESLPNARLRLWGPENGQTSASLRQKFAWDG